jgi:hypothetical protein
MVLLFQQFRQIGCPRTSGRKNSFKSVLALHLGHVPLLQTKHGLTDPDRNISLEMGSLHVSHRRLVVTAISVCSVEYGLTVTILSSLRYSLSSSSL